MSKTKRHGEVKIEILSVEFGCLVGSITIDGLVAGYVCFDRVKDYPKRTGNVIRRLRLNGIPVTIPNHSKKFKEDDDGEADEE